MVDSTKRQPAEVFHAYEFIEEELLTRGWSLHDLAQKMGGDVNVNEASLQLLSLKNPDIFVGEESAQQLGRAFGVSSEYFLTLDQIWRDSLKSKPPEGEAP
jgi:plasmid maintenance system antidote protein VapI